MGSIHRDSLPMPASSNNLQVSVSSKILAQKGSAVSSSAQKTLRPAIPQKTLCTTQFLTGQMLCFLLKVAALETVRRLSKPRCPLVWRAVQASQVLCYSPFKWIRRWGPLKLFVNGMRKISRPILLLSVTTEFHDSMKAIVGMDHSHSHSGLPNGESTSELRGGISTSDSTSSEEPSADASSENHSMQIYAELTKHGITLPDRIDQDELLRFYAVANGDLSCLLSSLKRTIRWRETYKILSQEELEKWSHLVFWHGLDVMHRPCLIIRLGPAISSMFPRDRQRFSQAIVSQIEFGVVNLVNEKDQRITVLMDCEGLSPFRFPMHMLRSCSTLIQENYPNRLASLYIIRLPAVVRVLAHTFIRVLKPATRQKLHFQGEGYHKVLSELLQAVPKVLGGDCTCAKCAKLLGAGGNAGERGTSKREPQMIDPDDNTPPTGALRLAELRADSSCRRGFTYAVVTLLVIWIVIAFLAGRRNEPTLLEEYIGVL